MKLRTFFLTAVIVVLSLFPRAQDNFAKVNIPIESVAITEYTYVEVFENGSWWTCVYDGAILIDRYPIED